MEFEELVNMMQSSDYKVRFKAEYFQLQDRCKKLHRMLIKYEAGTLVFSPNCPIELLQEQFTYMTRYLYTLEKRAEIERIEL